MEIIRVGTVEDGIRDLLSSALVRGNIGYGYPTDFWKNIFAPNLNRCVALLASWLEFTFQLGDGGSSPRPEELSTAMVGVCPSRDETEARRIEALLRESKRKRRALLEIARDRARVIMDMSSLDWQRTRALDECRLAFVVGCLFDHQMMGLGVLVPSRISSASIYFTLSILRKHDPRFEEYSTTLALALPPFSNQREAGYQGWSVYEEPLRLRSVIYEPHEAASIADDIADAMERCKRSRNEIVEIAQPIDLHEGEGEVTRRSDPKRDALMDIFHGVILLAGMCVEHGSRVISQHAHVPPDKRVLKFLVKKDREQWERWAELLNAVWSA